MAAKKTLQLQCPNDIHFRSWATLVNVASRYQSDVRIVQARITVDAKSMLSLTLLLEKGDLTPGADVHIEATGADAEEAVLAVWTLFENHLGEPRQACDLRGE